MNKKAIKELKKIEWWFFWFWTNKLKVSILILILLVFSGSYALYKIPKESSPNVNAGIITIITTYPGVSPEDMDSLITDKIETEIESVDGIDTYSSNSSLWVSSITITLETDAVTRDVLSDVKDKVDIVDLPEDANDPIVSEVDVTNDNVFSIYLYAEKDKTSKFDLLQKAQFLKNKLENSTSLIWDIDISPSWEYEIQVLIDKKKIEKLNLSLASISNIIKSYNKNTPIWNYTIDKLNYDFRFDWEFTSIEDLKNIIISSGSSSFLTLWDIATIKEKYTDTTIETVGFPNKYGYKAVTLTIKKSNWSSIFSSSEKVKTNLEKIMSSENTLSWFNYVIFNDMSERIIEDYMILASSAVQTLALVFITILFFISFKEALIIVFILPLSFFVTFLILNAWDYSMNFLTNFSLILSLVIAIDTIIVVVEWATEKQKLGYNKKTAVLMAISEFKAPLISGTLTTLAVFLPLMFLPWMMWKFMAYIPVTVFVTLLASLIIALTLSSTIYYLFAKNRKYYFPEPKIEKNMRPFQLEILAEQREWKQEAKHEKLSAKEKILANMWNLYYNYLDWVLKTKFTRIFIIIIPFVLMILSMMYIPAKVGFTMVPATDEGKTTITLEAKEGSTEKSLQNDIDKIDELVSSVDDIKLYSTTTSGNKVEVYVEAIDKADRDRTIFSIQSEILKKFDILKSRWYKVSSEAASMWPPSSWGEAWVKLVADSSKDLDKLKKVASDFLDFTYTIKWAKNNSSSSSETPWQFIFKFNKDKLSQLGLTPNSILNEVYFYTNWVKAWSISSEFEDNDIVLKIADFEDDLSPEDILNLVVPTTAWNIRVWDIASYTFTKAVSTIKREDSKIMITVWVDAEDGYLPSDLQPQLDEFAANYDYPVWIHKEQWWENEENSDLLIAMLVSFLIAVFLMFFILVTQFNSYGQPIIILFSVILSLLWVNIWLYVTGNPYSMPSLIWFIALAWVVVNDSIVLIDRINRNLWKWLEYIHAVAAAGRSRLQPVLVTTITTALWVFPLALQNAFWAGLAYTIMFGIFVGSALTIFCIPLMYYTFFLRKKKIKK